MEEKLFKLLQKEENLLNRKAKLEDEIKKVQSQIKELEHQQKVREIEDSIVVLSGHGINLKDVIKEIQKGNFDHLKQVVTSSNKQESEEVGHQYQGAGAV